jgi:hypothetical protein
MREANWATVYRKTVGYFSGPVIASIQRVVLATGTQPAPGAAARLDRKRLLKHHLYLADLL